MTIHTGTPRTTTIHTSIPMTTTKITTIHTGKLMITIMMMLTLRLPPYHLKKK